MTYAKFFVMAQTVIFNQPHKFFRDGSARRAALAAVHAQGVGCGREAIIDMFVRSLESDSHICYFDDPCDDWKVAA